MIYVVSFSVDGRQHELTAASFEAAQHMAASLKNANAHSVIVGMRYADYASRPVDEHRVD
jgi:hypothetical protein